MSDELAEDQTPLTPHARGPRLSAKWTKRLDGQKWFIPESDYHTEGGFRSTASEAAQARGVRAVVNRTEGGVYVQAFPLHDDGGAPGEPMPPAPTHELPGGTDDD